MTLTADELVATARHRQASRDAARVPIDYEAANKEYRQQKRALTRAINGGDRDKLVVVCAEAVRAWDRPGRMWPDDWSRWQRALDDVFPFGRAPDLEDLR